MAANRVQVDVDNLKAVKNSAETLRNVWDNGFSSLTTALTQANTAKSEFNQSYVHSAANEVIELYNKINTYKNKARSELDTIISGLNYVAVEYETMETSFR